MQEGEVLDLVITILSDRLESLHVHHSINAHSVVSPRYLPVLEALPAKAYCSLPATSRRRRVPQVQVPLPPAPMTLDTPPIPAHPQWINPLPLLLISIASAIVDIFIASIRRFYAIPSSHSEFGLRVEPSPLPPLRRANTQLLTPEPRPDAPDLDTLRCSSRRPRWYASGRFDWTPRRAGD